MHYLTSCFFKFYARDIVVTFDYYCRNVCVLNWLSKTLVLKFLSSTVFISYHVGYTLQLNSALLQVQVLLVLEEES